VINCDDSPYYFALSVPHCHLETYTGTDFIDVGHSNIVPLASAPIKESDIELALLSD
jgi:hypothetical protein